MKKILYVDPISYNGHKVFNEANLRILEKRFSLSVFFREDYLDLEKYTIDKVYTGESKYYPNFILHKSKLYYFVKKWVGQIKIIKRALKIAKKEHYDYIYFSTVDIVPFFFGILGDKQRKGFVDHTIYLSIEHKWLRVFWKLLPQNCDVIVLEDYCIKQIKNGFGCKNDVYCIRHPLKEKKIEDKIKSDKVIIFAPSIGNDDGFLQELIRNEKYIPDSLKIIIRGESIYESDKLVIYSRRIEDAEYYKIFKESTYILIPYPASYVYRTSGVLFEAVAMGKRVLVLTGNTLDFYSKKYPNLVYMFSNFEEFITVISQNNKKTVVQDQFEKIWKDYGDSLIGEAFEKVIGK